MDNELISFQLFFDEYAAINYGQKLEQANIYYEVKKLTRDKIREIYLGTTSLPEFELQVRASDFLNAHKALEVYYEPLINEVEADYYLLAYNKNQLVNIIRHPENWGHFDYQLAVKLLKDLNVTVNQEYVDSLREKVIDTKQEFQTKMDINVKLVLLFVGIILLLWILKNGF